MTRQRAPGERRAGARDWRVALTGLFLTIFAIVALSGPGRIDIVDGQTRYEVARSIVDHGDHVIRNPDVWFGVFPGRDGQLFTTYRFPQSLVGVVAIVAADATGPNSEARRHFFFTLIGAVVCGLLAVTYALWFRSAGHTPRAALLWAGAGILCTPNWFYGTSTFDDILGAAAVVAALVFAHAGQRRQASWRAAAAGLMLGLAFNCKQPLGIFVLPVLGAMYDPALDLRLQWRRLALVVAGLALGVAAYAGYDIYKYPPGAMEANAELLERYISSFPGKPGRALLALTLSPGASIFFYCPPVLLALHGLVIRWRRERWLCAGVAAAVAVFTLFTASLTIFKGDPAWGPRYFTPVTAVLWLFVPAAARTVHRGIVAFLLITGFAVQVLALTVDPHRLYIERAVPAMFGAVFPELYFEPELSHLVNRPREIAEILRNHERAERYTPAPTPTSAFPLIEEVESGDAAVGKYHVLNSFRPWWASMGYLQPGAAPVKLARMAAFLVVVGLAGLAAQLLVLFRREPDRP